MYKIVPINQKEAYAFINEYHRHNVAPQGDKYRIGLTYNDILVGVVVVGRPIARRNDDGFTLEVTRNCVLEGHRNACSRLYASAWRAGKAMGYTKMITYTLETENGTSLKAAGWKLVAITSPTPKGWDSPSRRRKIPERYPTCAKHRWEIVVQ